MPHNSSAQEKHVLLRSEIDRVCPLHVPKAFEHTTRAHSVWGHEHFMAYFRDVGDVLPIIQKKGFAEALLYLFFKVVKLKYSIDKKARNRNIKQALKLFPENKEMLKEWRKNIDEVL